MEELTWDTWAILGWGIWCIIIIPLLIRRGNRLGAQLDPPVKWHGGLVKKSLQDELAEVKKLEASGTHEQWLEDCKNAEVSDTSNK